MPSSSHLVPISEMYVPTLVSAFAFIGAFHSVFTVDRLLSTIFKCYNELARYCTSTCGERLQAIARESNEHDEQQLE